MSSSVSVSSGSVSSGSVSSGSSEQRKQKKIYHIISSGTKEERNIMIVSTCQTYTVWI